ncbi:MAG: MetQ/NlpA family ABC transporter substrate-binding protein [Culicoidibacterales bacterium]
MWGNIQLDKLILAFGETLYMTVLAGTACFVLGLALGLCLYVTDKDGLYENKWLNATLTTVVNLFRAVPFIILLILLLPVTKVLVGTILGANAALPALIIGMSPFYARLVQVALREVDSGVIEAAKAMGASNWDIVWKVLIPESKPAWLGGLTSTIVSLVGFTAMAGVIGAGGLGNLAYLDGFQRGFDDVTIVATALILVLVFSFQWLGETVIAVVDKRSNTAKQPKRAQKGFAVGLTSALVVGTIATLGYQLQPATLETLTVGATTVPHAEILTAVKPVLAEQGIELKIVEFQDYVLPNKALVENELDANYFQHEPYLAKEIAEKGYDLVSVSKVHIEPMGAYSQRYTDLSALPQNATVLMSNSVSDQSRILALLAQAGMITLAEGVDATTATFTDIVSNPKNLQFKYDIEAKLLPTVYKNDEADLIFINTNYALEAGLTPEGDALLLEGGESPYANIVVTRDDNQADEKITALIEALHSQTAIEFIETQYNGAVLAVE